MITKDYYNQETRRGFAISEIMKRSWAADLTILDELLGICKKHDIKLFACYGTLLGAIRENGFIPWDDDIDMGLVGDDYVRFLDLLSQEYSDRYNILNPYTRTWYNMNFTHITNNTTTDFSKEYLQKWHGCPFMTGPDIYPYYYIPRDPVAEKHILSILEEIDAMISLTKQSKEHPYLQNGYDESSNLNEMIATHLVNLQHETGYEFTTDRPLDNQLEILYDQVCRITEYSDADYVARYDEYIKDRSKKFPKDYFDHIIEIPFEYLYIPVPIGYDAILRARFGGNYIVPMQERGSHDYPYYRKQLDEEEYRQACIREKGAEVQREPQEEPGEKKVLYHTSVKEMLIHCSYVIPQIRKALSILLNKRGSRNFCWMPDMFLKTDNWALDDIAPNLVYEYESLLQNYIAEGGQICDPLSDIESVAEQFDEYYGDECKLAKAFWHKGKSVTIQDYEHEAKEVDDKNWTKDIFNEIVISQMWKDKIFRNNGSKKMVLLYVSSVSVMYQYKETYLRKLKELIDIFKIHKEELVVIWKLPHITMEMFGTKFISEYLNVLDEIMEFQYSIICKDSEIGNEVINIADAYLGDPSQELLMCRDKYMPVMIQSIEI